MEPEEFQRKRGIAFDRGRSGPAELNAAAVDALNDAAVRKQARKPRPADAAKGQARARSARRLAEGRHRKMVADDQGRQRQGGLRRVLANSAA